MDHTQSLGSVGLDVKEVVLDCDDDDAYLSLVPWYFWNAATPRVH